jgi:hypothetical protein
MKLGLAIGRVRDDEAELARQLGRVGERHHADHDVFHMSRTLAGLHHGNLEALQPFGERYGAEVDPSDAELGRGPLSRMREATADLVGRRPEAGLLLLRDIRDLHLHYAAASIDWVMLGQAAQVARDRELLETVAQCHAQTLRGMRWTVTHLKVVSPQVLAL